MDGFKEIALRDIQDMVVKICEKEYEHCFQLLDRLIACKSYSGQEQECAEVLLTFFKNRKIPAMVDERGSVLALSVPAGLDYQAFPENSSGYKAWLQGLFSFCNDRNIKTLAYNAHMDVVEAENESDWSSHPFRAIRRDGKIYGRGSCDMKGALAAMATSLWLMSKLDSGFARETLVMGCFCTEEEAGEGLAFKELCEEFGLRPDAVLLGEPSQMQIAVGQRGKLEFWVDTSGKAVHTSVPETGDNAAYKMARALLAIENLEEEERFRHGLSAENVLKRNTIVATSIKSWPESRSFVPERARIHVTARTALGTTFENIKSRLEADEGWPEAEIIPVFYRGQSYTGKKSDWPSDHPAWHTEKEHDFFKALERVCQDILKREVKSKIWPFSTDGVYSAGMAGIATLGLGPGREDCAHIIDEWITEAELLEALKVYTCLGFCYQSG
ncbi:MAG: YgeY family selenium metabolism-linked hydrolase [Candidatus Rifleibacteriota bacterium]